MHFPGFARNARRQARRACAAKNPAPRNRRTCRSRRCRQSCGPSAAAGWPSRATGGLAPSATRRAPSATKMTGSVQAIFDERIAHLMAHEEMPQCRAADDDQADEQPGIGRVGEHGIVVADHHQQHRQRQIGVVQRALLADGAEARDRAPRRAISAAVIFRWLGMMTAKTLAAMIVPMKTPDMDEGAAAGEDMGEDIGEARGSARRPQAASSAGVPAERRAAEPVIDRASRATRQTTEIAIACHGASGSTAGSMR